MPSAFLILGEPKGGGKFPPSHRNFCRPTGKMKHYLILHILGGELIELYTVSIWYIWSSESLSCNRSSCANTRTQPHNTNGDFRKELLLFPRFVLLVNTYLLVLCVKARSSSAFRLQILMSTWGLLSCIQWRSW